MGNSAERRGGYVTQPSLALMKGIHGCRNERAERANHHRSWFLWKGWSGPSMECMFLALPPSAMRGLLISCPCGLQDVESLDKLTGHNGIHTHLHGTELLPHRRLCFCTGSPVPAELPGSLTFSLADLLVSSSIHFRVFRLSSNAFLISEIISLA